ncbi:MAG: hypothetical protein IJ367_00300, partial [Clostridia bacterium]|nr:hypothetical protein [Clostridia bacterium]
SAASYLVMLACGGESLWECFSVPKVLGNTITCIATLLIVSFGIQGVYRFNLIATPLLILMMIFVSLVGLTTPVFLLSNEAEPMLNLLTYTGYNLLSMLPFLGAISAETPKKEGIRGILLGYFLIAVAGLLLKTLLNVYHSQVADEALPILKITDIIHPNLTYLYTVMLYLAVLTTAVNALYAITRGKYTIPVALILLGFSLFGFTNLLGSLYPLFGYAGIGIVVLILWKILSEKPNRKENKLWQTKKT